jgi:hypothetical protein
MHIVSRLWEIYSNIENHIPDGLAELIEEELATIDEQREEAERREKRLAETLELLRRVVV